jgi:hypothetical protein
MEANASTRLAASGLASLGPRSLKDLSLACLRKYRENLHDIGDVDVALLGPVLLDLTPEALERVEVETERGGRNVRPDLWPLWYRHVKCLLDSSINLKKELKNNMKINSSAVNAESPLRDLACTALKRSSIRPADYRQVYSALQRRKQELLVQKGQQLRNEFKKTEQKKTIKVISDPLAMGNPRARYRASRGPSPRMATNSTIAAKNTPENTATSTAKNTATSTATSTGRAISKSSSLARKLGIAKPPTSHPTSRLQRESLIRKVNKGTKRYKMSQMPTIRELAGLDTRKMKH